MQNVILVFIGAGFGGVLRFLFGKSVANLFGSSFPFGTLGVNIIGSFIIGFCAYILTKNSNNQQFIQYFIMTGILGGFTTFSTFSLDVIKLFEAGRMIETIVYILASVLLSIIAVLLGMALGRQMI